MTLGKNISFRRDYVASRAIGRCYICNYTGHTSHNCPLSLCTYCSKYGHQYSACPERIWNSSKLIAAKKKETLNDKLAPLPPIPPGIGKTSSK